MSTIEAAGPARGLPQSCGRTAPRRARSRTAARPAAAPAPQHAGEAWSEAAVEQLHEALLRHALQALHTRGNVPLKREILRWIFCPQPMLLVLPDPQGRPRLTVLPQHCTPFSFAQCCRICGYHPQRLRDGLASLLPAIGLAATLAEIAGAAHPGGPGEAPRTPCAPQAPAPGASA